MKSFYILFLLILSFSITHAQWTNQNPVPDGNHLWSTFFVDDNTGWIVGSGGLIKKTTNAGLDWILQSSGTTLTLKSVQFINQNNGWICGEEGLIIKTTDGGQNWFELTSGTTAELTDLQFCNSFIGYAVGYNETILKTTNGGTSWVTQHSGSTNDLYSVDFVDALLGYAVGGRDSIKFLKTTDGGLNWLEKKLVLGAVLNTPILNCVEFVDAKVGWIGAEGQHSNHSGYIGKTTDGGETWLSKTMYRPADKENIINNVHETENKDENKADIQRGIRSIYFKDSNNGYAVGGTRDGWWRRIFTTTDAGTTWQSKYGYSEQTGLLSVFVTNSGKGWAVGYYGVIYTTENNGLTWSQILSGSILPNGYTGDRIYSVSMINDSVGWACGSRKGIQRYPLILKTTNGGKIWKTIYENNSSWYNYFSEIYFINENIGWASMPGGSSYNTTNGGVTWNTAGLPADEIFINQDVWTASSLSGPAGIRKNWVLKSSVSSRSIYFSDINNGWAVGPGGSIIRSTDVGESWVSKTSGTISDLNSVRFYNSNVGMCVGNSGTVLLSTNGGENWVSQSLGTTATLNSVTITNATTAWIAGSGGTILNTTDFGNSWIPYNGLGGNLTSLHFINEYTGWVCGDNNIYKYSVEPDPPTNHFNPIWSGNPYAPMNIDVTGVSISGGGTLGAGDEIGVFDGTNCVGSVVLTESIPSGGYLSIIASTDDPNTTAVDGFTPGHTITYKFWLSASSTELTTYNIEYTSGNGTFSSQGSAVVSFESVLPVELTSFTASLNKNEVNLIWETATELNNYGFEIERRLSDEWQKIGFINGNGNSSSPKEYSYVDKNLIGGSKFIYRLKQIDNDGQYKYSNIVEVENVPTEFTLYQNYPNPFNPSTKIRYQLPNESKVVIKIYNVLGSEVMELLNEQKVAGVYQVEFNAENLSSGTYIYRIIADSFVETKKMILLK